MTDKRIKKIGINCTLSDVSEHYVVRFYCQNCSEQRKYRLPKGVPQKGIKIDCENCGCEGELL